MALGDRETGSLIQTAKLLEATSDPWWILGSAAVALVGGEPGQVKDIDVLVSNRDALALMRLHGLKNVADGGNQLFRSQYFLRPETDDLAVEIMAGFSVCSGANWVTIMPLTRIAISLAGTTVFVPDANEQIELLHLIGRAKDQSRIEALQSLSERHEREH